MAERQWTSEQLQCINARGGTLLVSAAAGSGKTSVLVERVIGLVTDDHAPVDIDRLLVVTFTKAAAAEMKQRLSWALSKKAGENPDDIRLQRQQMMLARANISTVHGFCSSLLREHFHLLGLTPQFRIAEDTESMQLAEDALGEVVEELYKEDSTEFGDITALLSSGKNDGPLFNTILKIYSFVQSHPFPEKWLEEKLAEYTTDLPLEQTPWGKAVLDRAGDILKGAASLISRAVSLSDEDPTMAERYSQTLKRDCDMLESAALSIPEMTWDMARASVGGLTFGNLPQLRKYPDESRKERVQALRNKAKDEATKKLPALFCGSQEECRDDIREMAGQAEVLFDAVRRFSVRFSEMKKARGLVDYNDLEHMSLELLVNQDGTKTPLAHELSQRYDEVMVDEYQDTNAAQDALFRALSRDEKNLFMVGDVKQSIYGFRQAMPEIFLARRDSYPPFDGKGFPASITLGHNFRSRPQITDTVNFMFRQLMTKSICGMDYDRREELIAAAEYSPQDGCDTELLIIDGATRDKTQDSDSAEARVIAAKIHEIMSNFQVTENGEKRGARYGDICILLRSKTAHAQGYADELTRCGIPVWTSSSGGLFTAPEVAVAVSLLRVIDNPVQDVPLLSVLLSAAFGFTPDDLTCIRLNCREGRLFTALRRYSKKGENAELRTRLTAFLKRVDDWRVLAVTLPADRLIHRVYEDASLPSVAAAMSHGSQRVANLRMLHETARRFERKGFRGLSAFVRFLDRVERQKGEISAVSSVGAEDAVRIISIHNSKGLEFPIVLLAGLGRQFNRESSNANLLLHAEMGVGFKRRDSQTLTQWNTLPRLAVSLTMTRSERAEEIRVLYVAMTRAKEKLCMVMTVGSPEKKLGALAALIGNSDALPPHAVLGGSGIGDWVLSAALRHPSGGHLRGLAGDDGIPVKPAEFDWKIEVLRSPPPQENEAALEQGEQPDGEFISEIERRMEYSYPYSKFSALPAKLAASELSHGEVRRENVAVGRPAFLSQGGLTPAERGTALHSFMQFAKYKAAAQNAETEVDRLINQGFLTPEQGEAIPIDRVKRFFKNDLYTRMENADRLLREVHFTIEIPATELLDGDDPEGGEDEMLVIQGIADCVIEERCGLTVVDYKTDYIKTPDMLIQRYKEQLRIYSRALEKTLRLPVRECLLYSFSLNTVIDATHEIKAMDRVGG
ncbi:MAG: helicase-exonuclease AddAB subunit AddA [Oscillospiraceae bacterium]|nr:helicase-exonuclease AddAB subunit AddA [Oscillospiraceae bacterium]